MEEDRQKKIEAGREKFVAYQRRKQSSHHTVRGKRPLLDIDKMNKDMLDSKSFSMSSGDIEDEEKATAVNIPKLQESMSQMDLLKKEIKCLQESVIDKDHQIESLQIELETVKGMAHLDVSTSSVLLSPRQKDVFQEKICELQSEVNLRNKYIQDLSESLQQRSVAYEIAVVKEQQKSDEVCTLRQQLHDVLMLLEGKVGPTCTESRKQIIKLQSEVVELKNCAEEKMILVKDLREALERKESEYQRKINQLNKDKTSTMKEIQTLLEEVEKLKRRACNKEHELIKAKEQIALLQAEREKKFDSHILHMKQELIKNHEEEKERLNQINDEMLRNVLKKYETALNDCNDIATQLQACKLSHEAQVAAFNECMESLLNRVQEENRQAEAEYCKQLTKCNSELQTCRQQIDNFENRLCEEVRKVEEKCVKEIESYQIIYEAELTRFNFNNDRSSDDSHMEIQKLQKELSDMITAEVKKNIELETCRCELQRSKDEVNKLKKTLTEFISTSNRDTLHEVSSTQDYEDKISTLKQKLYESQMKEESLLTELSNSKGKIKEYEEKVNAFKSNFQEDLNQVEDKQKCVVKAFEEEIQTLTAQLEESKSLTHQELPDPCDELQQCKNELSAFQKMYNDDAIMYQNQVSALKKKIEMCSKFEDKLISQLITYAKNLKDLQNKIKLMLNKNTEEEVKLEDNTLSVHDIDALKSEMNFSQVELHKSVEILGSRLNEMEEQLKSVNVPVSDSSTQCSVSEDEKYVQCVISGEHKYVQCTDEDYVLNNIRSSEFVPEKKDTYFEKTNVDLVNKYAELSAMYADLESKKDNINEENKQIKADMDKLVIENKELNVEKNVLLKYVDSLKHSVTEINSISSPENIESGTSVQHDKIKFIFKNAVTSTPNTVSEENMKTNNIKGETPKREQDDLKITDSHCITVNLMKQCNALEEENKVLTKNIEVLRTNVKEMEHCVAVAHNEISVFEGKCRTLESKITELEALESKIRSLEEKNVNAQLRIGQLEKERELLRLDVKVISEESLLAEKKNNSNITKLYEKVSSGNTKSDIELLVLELKQKSDDVIILKEKLYANQEVITTLKDKLDEMFVSMSEGISKFESTRSELKITQQELEDLRKDRGEITLTKRLLEKENVLLKIKMKELESRRERTSLSCYNEEMIKVIEELQKEIVNLTKQTLNDRQLIENLKIEKSLAQDIGGAGEMSITQRLEFLIKSKGELMEEKHKLIMCLGKHQELLSAYQSGTEVRGGFLEELHDLQDKLIRELQLSRQQDEKTVEVFISNNRLRDMLSTLQDQIVITLKEKTQMEESFQESEVSLKAALLKLSHFENQLAQNKSAFKDLKEERHALEEKLSVTEELLRNAEEELEKQKLSFEVQVRDREVRLKQGQLELIAVQCEHARQNSEPPMVRSVYCDDIRTELMQQHAAGLAKIQRHYAARYNQALLELNEEKQTLQQQHQEQVMKLQNELRTKTKELEELVTLKLNDDLSLPEYLNNIQFQDLVYAKEKSKSEIEELKKDLDEKGVKLFYILRDKFQQYAQHQIMFSIAKLKNEHEKELENEMSALKLQYDLHLQKVQSEYEVAKQNEVSLKLQELEKLYLEELTALNEVVEMYNRKQELSQCSESGIALKQLIQCLANDYKCSLSKLNEAWKEKYHETLDEIMDELNQNFGITESSTSMLDTNLTDSEKLGRVEILMEQQEKVICCAQDLYVKLEEQHIAAIKGFQSSLEICHEKVVNVVQVLKEQLEYGSVIASFENEVHKLKIDKRGLQEQHKSALDLLHKDHEAELNKFQDLLNELQQLSKEGSDAKAMYILRTELETKHAQEMEELRTYFEKKCADLEKNCMTSGEFHSGDLLKAPHNSYSEEIYSQHSHKVSGSSSGSDSEAIVDMYYSGGGDMSHRISSQPSEIEVHLHEKCERRLAEVRDELSQLSEEMEIKYQKEVEAVELKYAIIFQDYIQENMTTNQNAVLQELERRHTESLDSFYERARKEMEKEVSQVKVEWENKLELAKRDFEKQKESGIRAVQKELQEKYCRKIEELEKKFLTVKDSKDVDILVAQIEAVVRAEYDSKLEKAKEEIEEKCMQKRDEDIENMDKLHKERIEKLKEEIEKTEIQRRKDETEKVKRKMHEAHNQELIKLKEHLQQEKAEEVEKILLQMQNNYDKDVKTDKKEIQYIHEEELEKVRRDIAKMESERKNKEIENIKKEMLDSYNEELKNAIEEIEKREIDSREKEVDKIKRELLEAHQREIEKAREEIERREINKWEDEVKNLIINHNQELQKLIMKYENMMKAEVNKAVTKARNEAHYQLELEEKVKVIKEEVRADYDRELERLREEIEEIENQRREEEIQLLREALNDAYEKEVNNIKQEFETKLKRKIQNIKNETNAEIILLENAHKEETMKLKEELEIKVVQEREFVIEEENKAANFKLKQLQDGYNEEMKRLIEEKEQLNTKAAEEIDRLNVRLSELEIAHKQELAKLEDEWEKKLDKEREFIAKEENKMAFLKINQLEEAHSEDLSKLNEDWQRKLAKYEEDYVNKEKEVADMLNMQIRDLKNMHKEELVKLEEKWEQKLLNEKEFIAKEENKMAYLKIQQMEEDYKDMFQKLNEDWKKRLEEERDFFTKEKEEIEKTKEEHLQKQVETARKEILHTLELKIKALVASNDDSSDKSDWPPELAALENQFAAKYQRQLAQIVQERAIEIAEIHVEYEAKIDALVKEYSAKPREMAPSIDSIYTGDSEFNKIIRERDCLKQMTCTLRQVVNELAKYLITCEDELNNTLIGELMKQTVSSVTSTQEHNNSLRICELNDSSESDEEENKSSLENKSLVLTPKQPKRVHFAPDVSNIVSLLDEDSLLDFIEKNQDVSIDFRAELESCLERLKLEASALLGLSTLRVNNLSTVEGRRLASVTRQLIEEKKAKEELNGQFKDLQELNMKYEQEISDLQNELTETVERFAKVKMVTAEVTNIEEDSLYVESPIQARFHKFTELQDKARTMIAEKGDCAQPCLSVIEELAREAEEAFRDREDLQQQIAAADKQLRSTRAFLEEQASEREQERDEFNKEVSHLQEQLRDRDKDWTTKERFASEWPGANQNRMETTISTQGKAVESLEQQVRETTELLKETERRKDSVEKELKAAIDKVWMLREIISDLEVQVSNKSEREATLEQRLDELETELEKQNRAQENMVQELEALRQSGGDQALLEQVRTLQEQLKKQTNSAAVRQMKSQLREMTKSVEKRTKDLEAVNIHTSTASLSSPSEDVSIREQLESLRCDTPEDKLLYNGSPPLPLPVEEVSRLHDKLVRHSRAEETVIKKIRDQHMQMATLRSHLEDVQSERDVLQEQCDRQLVQLASTQSKLEEVRRRFDKEQAAATAQLQERIKELETQRGNLIEKLTNSNEQIVTLRKQLEQAERVVASHESLLSSCAESQHELIDKLKQDLAVMEAEKNKLEAMVSKYRSEQNISLPALVEIMLADKNADIDQLQHRVTQLETQCSQADLENSESRVGHTNSKGHRVSFASDLTISHSQEGEKLRDVIQERSIEPIIDSSHVFTEMRKPVTDVRNTKSEPLKFIPEPEPLVDTRQDRAEQLDMVLLHLKSELEEKSKRLLECEEQLAELPAMEKELRETKEELVATVAAVTEDKKFYEEQLEQLAKTQKFATEREAEVESLRDTLAHKEEFIVKLNADVQALEMILENLQKSIQSANKYAEIEEQNAATVAELEKAKEANLKLNDDYVNLKKDYDNSVNEITKLQNSLSAEKNKRENLKKNLSKMEKEKENMSCEMNKVKAKCAEIEKELDAALKKKGEIEHVLRTLTDELNEAHNFNKDLNAQCQNLRDELQEVSKKHSMDLKNYIKKDSEEVGKLKYELEELKQDNRELQADCEKLRQELEVAEENMALSTKLLQSEGKISKLENELKKMEETNQSLQQEKNKVEEHLSLEIAVLKTLIDDLQKNVDSLEKSEKVSQNNIVKQKETQNVIVRKYDLLKRECERQRRAKKEIEKKYQVLKEELEKEKKYVTELEKEKNDFKELTNKKSTDRLKITEMDMFEIKPTEARFRGSIDQLAVEVQKELQVSAQLDNSIISGYGEIPAYRSPPLTPCPSSAGSSPRFRLPQRLTSPRTLLCSSPSGSPLPLLCSSLPVPCPSPSGSPPRFRLPYRLTSPQRLSSPYVSPAGSSPPVPCSSPIGSPPGFRIPSRLTSPQMLRRPCPPRAGSPSRPPVCVPEDEVDDMLEIDRPPRLLPLISDYAILDSIPPADQVRRWLQRMRQQGPIMPGPSRVRTPSPGPCRPPWPVYHRPPTPWPGRGRVPTVQSPPRILSVDEIWQKLNLTTPEDRHPRAQRPTSSGSLRPPREFLSLHRIQSQFKISHVGAHFMPVAHSTIDLGKPYLPVAYSPEATRESGGESPIFKPGQAMTRTMIIPKPRPELDYDDPFGPPCPCPGTAGQTFVTGARGQTFTAARRALDQTYTAAPRGLDQTYTAAPRALDQTYTAALRALDQTYTAAPRALDQTYTAAPRALDQTYTAAPRALDQTYIAAPRALDQTYIAAPCALDQTYTAAPRAIDQTYIAAPRALDQTYTAAPHALDQTYTAAPCGLDQTYTAASCSLDQTFTVAGQAEDCVPSPPVTPEFEKWTKYEGREFTPPSREIDPYSIFPPDFSPPGSPVFRIQAVRPPEEWSPPPQDIDPDQLFGTFTAPDAGISLMDELACRFPPQPEHIVSSPPCVPPEESLGLANWRRLPAQRFQSRSPEWSPGRISSPPPCLPSEESLGVANWRRLPAQRFQSRSPEWRSPGRISSPPPCLPSEENLNLANWRRLPAQRFPSRSPTRISSPPCPPPEGNLNLANWRRLPPQRFLSRSPTRISCPPCPPHDESLASWRHLDRTRVCPSIFGSYDVSRVFYEGSPRIPTTSSAPCLLHSDEIPLHVPRHPWGSPLTPRDAYFRALQLSPFRTLSDPYSPSPVRSPDFSTPRSVGQQLSPFSDAGSPARLLNVHRLLDFSSDEAPSYSPESGYSSSGTLREILSDRLSPVSGVSTPATLSPGDFISSDSGYSGSLASPTAAVAEGGWHFSPGSGYSAGAFASPRSHYSSGTPPLAPPGSPMSPRPVYFSPRVLQGALRRRRLDFSGEDSDSFPACSPQLPDAQVYGYPGGSPRRSPSCPLGGTPAGARYVSPLFDPQRADPLAYFRSQVPTSPSFGEVSPGSPPPSFEDEPCDVDPDLLRMIFHISPVAHVPLPSQRIVDTLQQRLAAAETSLHVERMTIDELRRRIIQDRKRVQEDQELIASLKLEIQNLHTLNDVLEAKYNRVIEGISKSVSSIKEREQQAPATPIKNEKLFEEIQEESKKLEGLVKEKQELERQITVLRQQVTDLRVQKAILEDQQPALEQEKTGEIKLQLQRQTEITKSLEAKIRMLENAELSRQKRRRAAEQHSKTEISSLKADKQALEKENMALRLKLKHAQSHLNAIASESPLALKLNEANAELERLVAEKEDLAAALSDLKEEVKELSINLNEQKRKNENLKERLNEPNIIITDGRLDNLNAKLATERAAWAREKQELQYALAQAAQAQSGSSLNCVESNLQHLLGRYLRAESYRKALAWQKRYLLLALVGYQQEEIATVTNLKLFSNPFVPTKQGTKPKNRFKVSSLMVVSVVRMKNLVQRRQKVYESTCSVLYQAIIDAKRKSPRHSPAGFAHSAFTRPVRQERLQPLRPGTLAEHLEQFKQLQNRIAVLSQHTVSSAN